MYFLAEETLTAALYDGSEPGQSVHYLRKLKECFSILVLDIKKQTTSQEKKTTNLPNQKQLKVLTFLHYKLVLS